jgi:hypothetical protein
MMQLRIQVSKITIGAVIVLGLILGGYVDWDRKQARRTANDIWSEQMEIFEMRAAGRIGSSGEFEKACDFLVHLTGIPVPVDQGTMGLYPTDDLTASVRRFRRWHEANSDRLY